MMTKGNLCYIAGDTDSVDSEDLGGFPKLESDQYTHSRNLCWWDNVRSPFSLYNAFLWLTSGMAIAFGLFCFMMEVSVRLDNRLKTITLGMSLSLSVVGSAVLICCTIGCLSPNSRRIHLLRFYHTVFGVLVVIEVMISVFGIVQQSRVKSDVQTMANWSVFIRHYQEDSIREDVDAIQRHLKCCGFNNFNDWDTNLYYSCKSRGYSRCSVPSSCCKLAKPGRSCVLESRNPSKTKTEIGKFIYVEGCLEAIEAWYKYTLILLSAASLFIASLQLILRHYAGKIIQDWKIGIEQMASENLDSKSIAFSEMLEIDLSKNKVVNNSDVTFKDVSKVSNQQKVETVVFLDNVKVNTVVEYRGKSPL